MNKLKFISVLIPVHNEPEDIVYAVQSILQQTYPHFELLICDDGSDIPVLEILRNVTDNRIRIFRNVERMGIPYTRNRLMDESSHDLVAWLDADDTSMPNRLEKQIAIFKKYPKTLVCFTNAIIDFGVRTTRTRATDNTILNSVLLDYRQPFVFSSCMVKKTENTPQYRFDESYKRGQDFEYLLNLNYFQKTGLWELRLCKDILVRHKVKDDKLKPDTQNKLEMLADIVGKRLYAHLPLENVFAYIKFIRDIRNCNANEIEEAIYILFRGIYHENYWSKKQKVYTYTVYNYYILKASYFHSYRYLKELKWPINIFALYRLIRMKF